MVKTSFEDTFPWNDSNRWTVTLSVDTMKWVIKAWDEGLVEAESDLDSLKSENLTLKGIKEILEDDNSKTAGGTPGKTGPPPRQTDSTSTVRYNKLPPDQYQALRDASEAITKKCRVWLGSAGGDEFKDRGKLGALCRRYLFMAGYSGVQSPSDLPEYASLDPSKKDALNTLTKAQDSSSVQKESHVTEQMTKVTNLEKQLNEELKSNLMTWTFIMPANIMAISASAPTPPTPPEATPSQPVDKTKVPKAIQELKPKQVLTQNMSRPDLLAWERQMISYFKASNFEHCSSEIRQCYLEERMDQASQQLLRKLCNGTPEKHSMEDLFKKIREFVVRSDSLQQRRISQMLNFKQRQGEAFSQTLCRLEETERDVDIDNYTVAEMQAHLRIAACTDPKLKEELLKLGQPDINGEPTQPITCDLIWNATRNFEQRMKCLRSDGEDSAVSNVSTPRRKCKACMYSCPEPFEHCLQHKNNRSPGLKNLRCHLQNCKNPQGDHTTEAHKTFGPGTNYYRSNPPPPPPPKDRARRDSRQNSDNTSRGGSRSPQKYSRNNSQNREVVQQSKGGSGSAAISAITAEGAAIMGEADMFVDSEGSELEYVPAYEDFASCSIGTLAQYDGAMTADETDDDSDSDNGGEPEKRPEDSYSSTDSDDVLDIVVEVDIDDTDSREKLFESCSGIGEHVN